MSVSVSVSINSYAKGVQLALAFDQAPCPEFRRIIECLAKEFEQLLQLSPMMPPSDETPAGVAGATARWAR